MLILNYKFDIPKQYGNNGEKFNIPTMFEDPNTPILGVTVSHR